MSNIATPSSITLDENLIAMRDVPDHVPRAKGEAKVCLLTVRRWTRKGLSGSAPLETFYVGRSVFTSREALQRFFDRVSQAKDGHRRQQAVSTKAGEKADAELAAAGL